MRSLALLSMHGCPTGRPGRRDTGGMNVYLLETARRLGASGVRVDVFTRSHDPAEPQIVPLGEGARVIHVEAGGHKDPKHSLHKSVPQFSGGVLEFARAEGARYDLVHSHYWLSGLAGIEVAGRLGVPHVATFHTLAMLKLQARSGEEESAHRIRAETSVLESVNGVVVSTRHEAAEIARLYGVDSQQLAVVPPGVDLELFRPVDRDRARGHLGVTEAGVVLYVGRLEPLKGVDILIRAVADLQVAGSTRLMIVGGGDRGSAPIARDLCDLAKGLGIGDRVSFCPSVPQAELPNYYGAADVLVLPSHYESFGMVALEAMACGTPVVVSRVGGLGTFVRNGESGYLVPWRCPTPFAERIESVLSNPSLRRAMGRAALLAARRMGWDVSSRRLLEFYRSVAPRPGALAAAGGP